MKFFKDEQCCRAFETMMKLADEPANVYNTLEMLEALETLRDNIAPRIAKGRVDRKCDVIEAIQTFFSWGGYAFIDKSKMPAAHVKGSKVCMDTFEEFQECVHFV